MKRKTFEVKELVDQVNFYNRNSKDGDSYKVAREALNAVLEGVLHDTKNYNGFRYVSNKTKLQVEFQAENRQDIDDSRREYIYCEAK